jgi:electron transfer flavoprotein beta subunit
MNAVVLLHDGLDPGIDVEPVAPAAARHRGGDDVVVLAPADRGALERALALPAHVTALALGPGGTRALAHALARGAARAVRVHDGALGEPDLAATARLAAAACRALAADLVLAGCRGLAGSSGMLPPLVAAWLGWPCLDETLSLDADGDELVAERRLPAGQREELAVTLPAVVSVTADAAVPRYVSVAALRRAEARGHETWDLAALGLSPDAARAWSRARVERLDWPRPRPRRTARVAPARPAAERMRALLGGGRPSGAAPAAGPAEAARLVRAPAPEAAERILAFLRARGLIPP